MSKKEKKETKTEEPELLEETKELEQDTKINNEMLKLEEEIQNLTKENKTLEEKVKLIQADSINYRKRKDEETANALKYANQDIIKDLLNVVDNLERALKNSDNSEGDDSSEKIKKYQDGIRLIYENLMSILTSYGVTEINRVGEIFNPQEEQALLTECVEDKEDEVVLEVLLKGYKLKDRVIRPASVKINQK